MSRRWRRGQHRAHQRCGRPPRSVIRAEGARCRSGCAPLEPPRCCAYVAANVRHARERRGMTEQVVAEDTDLDLTYVQRVERTSVNASVATLVSLATALGVEPWNLMKPATFVKPPRGRPPRPRTRS